MTTQTSAWQGEPGGPAGVRAAPGDVIGGRYELRSPIGNGGMGTVWQAVDTVLRRDVAVKEVLLPPGMPPHERNAMYERTLREGRAAAALSHPSVVQVYDVVTEAGRPWIIMELLQARSLSEIIISDGPIAGRAVAKIGIALLGALEVAHNAGVLHRDVKPANVLICADGRCVLTDFGVARMPSESNLTQPGMVLGSPHFISPERAIGAAFGPPSDLFSLGVTLYTAIEGRPPFDRGDPFETMRAIVEEEPLPPVRAGALAPVLMGLLEKDPARRWTVPQARAALREISTGARRSAHAASAQGRPPVELAPVPPQFGGDAPGFDPDDDMTPSQMGGRAMLRPGESIEERIAANAARREALGRTAGGTPREGTLPVPPRMSVGDRFDQAMAAFRRLPRNARIGIPAALVVVIIVVIIATSLSGGGTPATTTGGGPAPSASSTAPPFAIQEFKDSRGITVDVPAGWKKASASSYTDFTDPDSSSGLRKIRINVEKSGNDTPKEFLEGAEHGLKTPSRCPSPYTRVSLSDATIDGRPGAILEYTCGSGADERHGIWAATTAGGKAYHFYLTVPDSEFAASKPIFDEMVRSFQLGAPAVEPTS